MKIFLIGKYPPLQGGISAKTYWLYNELEKHGFDFRAVTVETEDYSIKGNNFNDTKTSLIKIKETIWHIPETSLLSDRIFQRAMETITVFKPDLIEINYLWPFCMPALLVANMSGKPLMIRHAGSDIQKFYKDEEFTNIIKVHFEKASMVVTNHSLRAVVKELCDDSEKVQCSRRYIPNPNIFRPEAIEKKFDILFTGKINYYWNLKGIKLLFDLIKHRGLKALFIIGGKYKNKIIELIETMGTENQIKIMDFVLPAMMPEIYNSCRCVWCWDEKGSVEDFSNIIWEALYCGIPCIINSEMANRLSDEGIPDNLNQFIYKTSPERLMDIALDTTTADAKVSEKEKITLFEDYINNNIRLYETCNITNS